MHHHILRLLFKTHDDELRRLGTPEACMKGDSDNRFFTTIASGIVLALTSPFYVRLFCANIGDSRNSVSRNSQIIRMALVMEYI